MNEAPSIPLLASNSTVYVIDPQMRECAAEGGGGSDETEKAVDTICTLLPTFRALAIPIHFVWSKLDASAKIQMPQNLPEDAPEFAKLTLHFKTSLGGFHPKILEAMRPGDMLHAKFTTSALHVPAIRSHIKRAGAGNDILLGFNYSDCVTRFGVDIRADKTLPPREVHIVQEATADSREIAIAEMYSDCGVGESPNSMLRRALNVRTVKKDVVMGALGVC